MADYDEAVQIFQVLPDSVLSHEGLVPLLKEDGDIIAKGLPSVDTFWTPGLKSSDLLQGWMLSEKVGEFPVLALGAAIRSQNLKTESENYTFTLCIWWCLGKMAREDKGPENIQPFFEYLLQSLRFSRMSTDFFTTVVDDCAWVRISRHFPTIMKQILLKTCALENDKTDQEHSRVPNTRSYSSSIRVGFSKSEIESLKDGQRLQAPAIVYEGYPLTLQLF